MSKFTTVAEFIDSLSEQDRAQVTLLRDIISRASKLDEHIKWNSPSYVLNGEDRITLSVRSGFPISVILHMGAIRPEDKNGVPIMKDPSGLIEWKSDIRGLITFKDLNDINAKSEQFTSIIKRWLEIAH